MTNNHGGHRPGSGRKPAPYGKTKVVRVPEGCLETVKKIVKDCKDKAINNRKLENEN